MPDALSLSGRAAIVTGAGNGLGRAESLALARDGALLVLNDLPGDAIRDTAEQIRAAGGQAVVCDGDIGDWETGQRLVSAALDAYGRLDILVNNAGVLRDRMIFSMSAEEWDLVLRVHLRGHFVTTRFATAHWRAASKQAAGPVYARIVNTSSEAFLLGGPGQPNYAAAKAGIAALTVSTARGCARYGVRANAICPRARTAMVAGMMSPPPDDGPDPIAPEHVTPLVTYLAGPAAERDQRRGVRGARRRRRGAEPADHPRGLPGRHPRRHVDATRRARRPRGRVRRPLPRLPRLRLHRDHVTGNRDNRLRLRRQSPELPVGNRRLLIRTAHTATRPLRARRPAIPVPRWPRGRACSATTPTGLGPGSAR